MDDEPENVVAHFGVKGMKWGVRKEDDLVGRDASSTAAVKKETTFSKTEQAVVKKLVPHGYDEDRMRKMFGPDTMSTSPTRETEGRTLTEGQKKALKVGAGLAVAGVGLYALNRYGQKLQLEAALGPNAPESMKSFWLNSQKTKGSLESGYSKDFVNKLSTERVNLSAGSIVKRLSSAKETSIHPQGFFASYRPEDVERYKAVLPVYWKFWGSANSDGSGYVVNLKANSAVKAPSPKETYDMIGRFINDDVNGQNLKRSLKRLNPKLDDEGILRKAAPILAGQWNDPNLPATKSFFQQVKKEGFNAIVDLNDAGSLADSPMRFLDSSIFSIAGHDKLSAKDIRTAQSSVLELAHSLLTSIGEVVNPVEDFLAHYGVKGMKWGQRKRSKADEKARAARFKQKKKLRTMSDDDLKKNIDRLQNEKKLKSLLDEDLTPGRAAAKRMLSEAGQKTIKTVATGAVLYAGKAYVQKKFGGPDDFKPVEAAGYLFPKPKK